MVELQKATGAPRKGSWISPGTLRTDDVSIAEHDAPEHGSPAAFFWRVGEVYPLTRGVDALFYGNAATHRRFAWAHPFADGNGRAGRLRAPRAMFPLSGGLWSVNRGLTCDRDGDARHRSNPDPPRQGDLNGRGDLGERPIREWCDCFVAARNDQFSFMSRVLDLDGLRERVAARVAVRGQSSNCPHYGPELVQTAVSGPRARPIGPRRLRAHDGCSRAHGVAPPLAQLVKDGLLVRDGPKPSERIGFPLDALGRLFPNLYPEAATADPDKSQAGRPAGATTPRPR
jgi:hypothetical protein